jgi:hypothetical protein
MATSRRWRTSAAEMQPGDIEINARRYGGWHRVSKQSDVQINRKVNTKNKLMSLLR